MQCDILKSFPFSRDGIKTLQAREGDQTDIPDALVPGLEREGYVKPASGTHEAKAQPAPDNKAIHAAPETQAFDSAPEDKGEPDAEDDMKVLRADYREAFGKNPGPKWDADRIREEMAKA